MSTRNPQSEMLGLSQGASRLLDALPKIAFPLTILISVLTFPTTVLYMIEAFARGGDAAYLQELLPRLAQLTDGRGLGHYERLSINKWASVSHFLPGWCRLFILGVEVVEWN